MKDRLSGVLRFLFNICISVLIIISIACSPSISSEPLLSSPEIPWTSSPPIPDPTKTIEIVLPTSTPTRTPQPTQTPSPTFDQPIGCETPPDNYELIEINGMVINQRTFSMLLNAQKLYGGELELTGYHLTQGSYNNSVSASFGTHAGGGAVDLSVIQYGTYQVLFDDIDPLIQALRVAGFAAWLRDFDQLYPGSPIHIHAIAVGDRDLSQAAKDQLTGDSGYFRGYNGIPQPIGKQPVADEHGGPVICQWMIDAGYQVLINPAP